ncbi:MAG: hypothetical protein K1X94_30910 [Sandaracinaceae bacterium]|nr:hypothetical protein [Sandaracinaceae bacterium]
MAPTRGPTCTSLRLGHTARGSRLARGLAVSSALGLLGCVGTLSGPEAGRDAGMHATADALAPAAHDGAAAIDAAPDPLGAPDAHVIDDDAAVFAPEPDAWAPPPDPSCAAPSCEAFGNHGVNNPHLYASAAQNAFVGNTLARCRPTYFLEGLMAAPEPMLYGGDVPGTDVHLWYYVHPSDGAAHNAHLASEGCADTPDVRTQRVYADRYLEWGSLPSLAPVTPSTEELRFFVSSEVVDEAADTLFSPSAMIVYAIATASGARPGLTWRVDGRDWHPFSEERWGYFGHRPGFAYSDNHWTSYEGAPPKDFVFDVSGDAGATVQRFTVYRNHQGGHYSVVSTMTRQDGRVFLTVEALNAEASQVLRDESTGERIASDPQYGMLFDLGIQPDGDRTFSLIDPSGRVIEPSIVARIRRTP